MALAAGIAKLGVNERTLSVGEPHFAMIRTTKTSIRTEVIRRRGKRSSSTTATCDVTSLLRRGHALDTTNALPFMERPCTVFQTAQTALTRRFISIRANMNQGIEVKTLIC